MRSASNRPTAYRNFKIIYKNISLKKNVVFETHYCFDAAYVSVSNFMDRLGYHRTWSTHAQGTRIYRFDPKGLTARHMARNPSKSVYVEVINLHDSRKVSCSIKPLL
jgi:hypothetical protein